MIYFDNAATNGFKICAVTDACTTVLKHLSANPGRSAHRLSYKGAEIVYSARESVRKLFNAKSVDRIIFTQNCTHALNQAMLGLVKSGKVVTTVFEHNSVLRPLYFLKNKGEIDLEIVLPKTDDFSADILSKVTDNTTAVIMTGASNVTGEVLPYKQVGKILKSKNIPLIVDGAQLAGHKKIDVISDNISLLAVPAHKALNGVMGSGALVINTDLPLTPITFGGTGTETFLENQPEVLPEKLESGTLNLPAIAGFYEGALYTQKNCERFGSILKEKTALIIDGLKNIDGIKIYSKPNECGIVAFNIFATDSQIIAGRLDSEYDIAVRGGFHCAPLIHKHLKTDTLGAVRVSLSPQNTTSEINLFLFAMRQIAKTL